MQGRVYSDFPHLKRPHLEYIAILPTFIMGIGLPLILNYPVLERFKFFRYWYYST